MSDDASPLAKLPKGGIDPAKLKLRELAEVERLVGRKIAGELTRGDLGVDVMQALLWIELRRIDPSFTFEQAGEYDLATIVAAFEQQDTDEAEPLDPTKPPPSAGGGVSGNGATSSAATQPSTTSGG